jgi:hypothetical protein
MANNPLHKPRIRSMYHVVATGTPTQSSILMLLLLLLVVVV